MKKLLYLTAFVLFLVSCADNSGFKITGDVSNPSFEGSSVYLYEYGTNIFVDSTVVENGKFVFEGAQEIPVLHYIRFNEGASQSAATGMNPAYSPVFVLENGKLAATLTETPYVTGTPENDDWTALMKSLVSLRADSEKIGAEMNSTDPAVVSAAEKKYEAMDNAVSDAVKKYIQAHPDNLSSAKLLYDFRYTFDEDVRRALIAGSGERFKSVPGIDRLIEHLAVLEKVAIGKKFTDLVMPNPEGKEVKLSDYAGKGKVVLIDFWASWCPPCRRDMPHLVEVYKEYKNKGFEVVGISFDRTEDAWKQGIKDLNITWPQMSDIKYWQSEGAVVYGVNSIPHTVLIDKDGTIIAKNLRGDSLDAKLKELFN
ncbi:AhpC/TSA family protein [Parabacteroides sp. OttesenSCG-928-G07]|nr:AhpC/TSA family protein [Parabacteroides sp. OttesenSCG-928-G21]MDL2278723.1 AhpC/TSA family protein [Parabacteroides sp. OttesenSCG-928-G07]